MNEIRIKERTFLFGVALIALAIFYLLLVDHCEPTANYNSQQYYHVNRAQVNSANLSDGTSTQNMPFVVYAVTPTYARFVQKAELTRYTIYLRPRFVQYTSVANMTQLLSE